MISKKKQLAVAVASIFAAGAANATVDMDNGTGDVVFTNDVVVDTTNGTDILNTTNTADIISAEHTVGFSIGAGTSKYVRFTFGGPLVGTALDANDFDALAGPTTDGNGGYTEGDSRVGNDTTIAISAGGQVGDDYVIIEVALSSGAGVDIQQDDVVVFQPQDVAGPPPVGKIEMFNKNTATITYNLFETAVDAVNQTNSLLGGAVTEDWFSWGPGYSASCANVSSDQIDVTNTKQFVDNPGNTDVFSVSVAASASTYTESGTLVDIENDYFSPGSTITVAGDFTAFTGGVTIDGNGMTLAGDELSATYDTAGSDLPFASALLNVTPDTNDEMVAGNYSFSIVDDGGATYDVGTLDLGNCGNLQYSGSTDRLDFGLTPSTEGGLFRQYARITNPSATGGDVTFTVYNDAGESATFDLGDIAGQSSSTLAARASSGLINIDDIYSAAVAAGQSDGSAFAINSGGKLRVEVRGEFGDDARDGSGYDYASNYHEGAVAGAGGAAGESVTNVSGEVSTTRTADGIYIQGVTVSRDNNAFFQTK